jgi:hypothetical protein
MKAVNENCPRGLPAVGDEAAKPVAEEIDRQVGREGPGEEDVAHLPRMYGVKFQQRASLERIR